MHALTTGPALDSDFRSEVRKYQDYRAVYEDFLRNFDGEDTAEPHGKKMYLNQLQEVADGRRESVHVDVEHFAEFSSGLPEEKSGGLNCLVENAFKAHTLMMEAAIAVKRSLPRSANALLARQVAERMEMATDQLPAVLRANFDVYLSPPSSTVPLELRSVKSNQIGRLVRMQCIVAKCSSVKPRMAVARYRCQDCGTDAFQPVNGKVFTPKMACDGQRCRDASRRGTLRLIQKECRFRKHETVLVQEPTKHVPPGGVPRYMDVVVEGGLTRQLSPGMEVTLGGILVPLETTHIYGLKDGNLQRTQFEVHSIHVHKKAYTCREESTLDELNAELGVYDMDPNIYDRLANSLAPAIHGHLDVKKALLLQLVGGTSESFDDGLKLRGDIHILLMGDPGVAKSQLLSKVAQIAPRSHYATGKGASGVGLTAAVTKDPTTGEFALEAGAIVLSDKGICCIDEFDKMDERDRTSIHEVMEQQTVSVAKAGLTATLNARTSILAAANPISGRYDLRKSVVRNINLPAALLSRFDLQFILLDQADMDTDSRIALHILKQHQEEGETREVYEDVLPVETLRKFVERAKMYSPRLPTELISEVSEYYVEARTHERLETEFNNQNSYTTPRTLFAVLRLSQALARLKCCDEVSRSHIAEAFRMVDVCKACIKDSRTQPRSDWRADILDVLREKDRRLANRLGDEWSGWMLLTEVEHAVIGQRGFASHQLKAAVQEYVDFGLLRYSRRRTKIAFAERWQAESDTD